MRNIRVSTFVAQIAEADCPYVPASFAVDQNQRVLKIIRFRLLRDKLPISRDVRIRKLNFHVTPAGRPVIKSEFARNRCSVEKHLTNPGNGVCRGIFYGKKGPRGPASKKASR